ncbi:protein nessun dorma isoform X2 [Contarinia nasturtii]|uniref:protein nessun dorma isoform X2 n=1 Tax=Contarinia nasturtii TaxID=265458 RepID=UPI0012D46DEF|nr:protein nessun dorma isoform X2 [Contarinia nasturtii]
MNVYEFEKSLLERMEESINVLQCKNSPVLAADVREEWACHVELKIEPAGWQAIWKLNRATCEEYKIKYPTVVMGTVNNVYFQDLMADFTINAVQDDDVHLPEIHEVPLEDLWPTIDQENNELNIERTADCIDELRFFYRNVWMPWDSDSDEEVDWCKKHLESRIRFCFDLKRGMSREMADYIRTLLAEARYIKNKREIMELEMSDNEDADEDPEKIEDFLRMQLRMIQIRNEIEVLENPVLRRTYENINFKVKPNNNNDQKAKVYSVTNGTLDRQLEYFESIRKLVDGRESVTFLPSLKDCLKMCTPRDYIYLPPGRHSVKWVDPLNSGGLLKAVSALENNKADGDINMIDSKEMAIVTTEESGSVFLSADGDYTIENVILDCQQVRLGIWIKSGTLTLRNCQLFGNRSSTGIGIAITENAKCILEHTVIKNVGTGITCAAGSTLIMNQSTLSNCGISLEMGDETNIQFDKSQMVNSNNSAILFKTKAENVFEKDEKKKIISDCGELRTLIPSFILNGDCTFVGNKNGNIAVVNHTNVVALQHGEFLEDNYEKSGFKDTDDTENRYELRMDVSV